MATDLTDGTSDAMANDIIIQGNDIYIAGQQSMGGNAKWTARYWKNGTAISLTDGSVNAVASSMAIAGNDIYVIGERSPDGITPLTCYWKNGILTDLSDQSTYAADQAITTAGNEIYMAWSASYNSSGNLKTIYSKNFGNPQVISDGTQNSRGSAVAISGTDVYIAGSGPSADGKEIAAKYWKNGNAVTLTSVSESAEALSIAVLDNDIYVAGYMASPNSSSKATYWKNGTAVSLTNGIKDALIRKIMVVKK